MCRISYEKFGNCPTILNFLCAKFMQMNAQGFVGMRRRDKIVVYRSKIKEVIIIEYNYCLRLLIMITYYYYIYFIQNCFAPNNVNSI